MSALVTYDGNMVPSAFGFNNTGVICYGNSILQLLVGCSSFASRVINAQESASQRATLLAMKELFANCLPVVDPSQIARCSANVIQSLISDLQSNRPGFTFGRGQESSSEMFTFLIDMLEIPNSPTHPITELLMHRYCKTTICTNCKKSVSTMSDYAINFNLFHYDASPPTTPEAFASLLLKQVNKISDFKCVGCQSIQTAIQVSQLRMLPEIIVITFNIYHQTTRHARYFPTTMSFPSVGEYKQLHYHIVGQVEHSGTLNSGHYWARCRRADGIFTLNDSNVSPSEFMPTPNTYMIAYHYTHGT